MIYFLAGFLAFFGDLVAFLALGFFGLEALGFLAFFSFLAAGFLAFLGVFLAPAFLAGFLTFFFSSVALPILKEPEAPDPLVWLSLPSATAFFN